MSVLSKVHSLVIAGLMMIGAFALQPASVAAQESTWEQIKSTGKIRMGVTEYPPYFVKDRVTGEWGGGAGRHGARHRLGAQG